MVIVVVVVQMTMFALLFALHFSAWLLVLVTIDRFIAVWFPFRATILCSGRRARLAASILALIVVLYIIHVFWTVELQYVKLKSHVTDQTTTTTFTIDSTVIDSVLLPIGGGTLSTLGLDPNQSSFDQLLSFTTTAQGIPITHQGLQTTDDVTPSIRIVPRCGGRASLTFMHEPFEYLKLTSYSILPFFTILVLNVLIVVRLQLTPSILRKPTSESSRRSHTASRPHSGVVGRGCSNPRSSIHGGDQSTLGRQARVTYMLLSVSVTYLLLTAPFTLNLLVAPRFTDRQVRARYQLVKAFFFLFMYANHAVNFYLYCLTGKKFRHELCEMFCSAKHSIVGARRRGLQGGGVGFRRSFTYSLSLRTGTGRSGDARNDRKQSDVIERGAKIKSSPLSTQIQPSNEVN